MRTILTLAAALVCAVVAACAAVPTDDARRGAGTGSRAPFTGADRPLVNDDWEIVRMATAHGVMTIEIELRDLEAAGEVARTLVAPLTADHAEVLVYVYPPGRGAGGHAPAKRIQWTVRDGYVETAYD